MSSDNSGFEVDILAAVCVRVVRVVHFFDLLSNLSSLGRVAEQAWFVDVVILYGEIEWNTTYPYKALTGCRLKPPIYLLDFLALKTPSELYLELHNTQLNLNYVLLLQYFALQYNVYDLLTRHYCYIFSLISSFTSRVKVWLYCLFQLRPAINCARCCVDVAAVLCSLIQADIWHTSPQQSGCSWGEGLWGAFMHDSKLTRCLFCLEILPSTLGWRGASIQGLLQKLIKVQNTFLAWRQNTTP